MNMVIEQSVAGSDVAGCTGDLADVVLMQTQLYSYIPLPQPLQL
jgi:hypothetical protein